MILWTLWLVNKVNGHPTEVRNSQAFSHKNDHEFLVYIENEMAAGYKLMNNVAGA
jgi:hypothetical protein